MLRKDGDRTELWIGRPIMLLQIFYTICFKLMYNHMYFKLFSVQSFGQHGFTLDIRIEDMLLCAEVVIAHHLKFNLEVRIFRLYAWWRLLAILYSRYHCHEYLDTGCRPGHGWGSYPARCKHHRNRLDIQSIIIEMDSDARMPISFQWDSWVR